MASADVGVVVIAYETSGDPSDPPVVLVNGYAGNIGYWDPRFIAELVSRGLRVVAFDNRDMGQSGAVDQPYSLADMASDIVGLLRALDLTSGHIVGVSMGGMIAQTMAVRFPDHVSSLCSIMSTPTWPIDAPHQADLAAIYSGAPAQTREDSIQRQVQAQRIVGSIGALYDEDSTRGWSGRQWDRGVPADGALRHALALQASGDRRPELSAVRVPTVVIHGAADTLVPPAYGEATAAAIDDARLLLIEDMGHDIPPGAYVRIADAIRANVTAAT